MVGLAVVHRDLAAKLQMRLDYARRKFRQLDPRAHDLMVEQQTGDIMFASFLDLIFNQTYVAGQHISWEILQTRLIWLFASAIAKVFFGKSWDICAERIKRRYGWSVVHPLVCVLVMRRIGKTYSFAACFASYIASHPHARVVLGANMKMQTVVLLNLIKEILAGMLPNYSDLLRTPSAQNSKENLVLDFGSGDLREISIVAMQNEAVSKAESSPHAACNNTLPPPDYLRHTIRCVSASASIRGSE